MKKEVAIVVVIMICLCFARIVLTSAESISDNFTQDPDNFEYKLHQDNTVTLTKYNGTAEHLAIPDKIDGYPVTSVALRLTLGLVTTSIYLPDSVVTTDGNPFLYFGELQSVYVAEDNPSFRTVDGVLYSKDLKVLICYPCGRSEREFSVPIGTEKIGRQAFFNCRSLYQLNLPEGLLSIGDMAFMSMNNIKSLLIPSTVVEMGTTPFLRMDGLEEIAVASGNSIFAVYDGALYNTNTNLLIIYPAKYVSSSFAFREGITAIGDFAFSLNDNALRITFPSTIISIGEAAFSNCQNMIITDLPPAIQCIGNIAFTHVQFEHLTIPKTVQKCDGTSFKWAECTSALFEFGMTSVPEGIFSECESLKSVQLPDTIESIGNCAFSNCKNLEVINLPTAITTIGENAFDQDKILVASVPAGSLSESYCKKHEIKYRYDFSLSNDLRKYQLKEGPLTVTLDGEKYTVLTSNMSSFDSEVIRSGFTPGMFSNYMDLEDLALIMFDINRRYPPNFEIRIKIKDKKYSGIDLRECSKAQAIEHLETIVYNDFSGTNKEYVTINDVPYLKFDWHMVENEQRYATIIEGDMIYVIAIRRDGDIRKEDAALLLSVVQSIVYE